MREEDCVGKQYPLESLGQQPAKGPGFPGKIGWTRTICGNGLPRCVVSWSRSLNRHSGETCWPCP